MKILIANDKGFVGIQFMDRLIQGKVLHFDIKSHQDLRLTALFLKT